MRQSLENILKNYGKKILSVLIPITLIGSPVIPNFYFQNYAYAETSKRIQAKRHFDKAKNYESQGYYGNALIELFKAKKYGEFETIINAQIKKLANKIKETPAEIKYTVKVMPFENHTNDTEMPSLIVESLNQYILKNKNLELKTSGDTNITINGAIHAFNIDENEIRQPKTVKYQEGTTKVPNPEFQKKLEELQRNYGEYLVSKEQKKSSDTDAALTGVRAAISKSEGLGWLAVGKWLIGEVFIGSEEDKAKFEAAKKDLENTPYYIEEPAHDWYNYDEITATREGNLKLTLKLIDSNNNILYNKTITENKTYRDISRPENIYAGVTGDPLELPSRLKIREELIDKTITSVSSSLDDAITLYYKKSLLKGAMANKANGNHKKVIEQYFRFLTIADKNREEENIKEAVTYINSQVGTSLSPEILLKLVK